MTRFNDNIYSGAQAATSAASSMSPVRLCRTHRFTGGTAATQTGTFPVGVHNLDAKLWILQQSETSAATMPRFTVSAGGVNLIAIAAVGSALGVLRTTTAGLGTITNTASATAVVGGAATAEVGYSVTMVAASADTTSDFQLLLEFNRPVSTTMSWTA